MQDAHPSESFKNNCTDLHSPSVSGTKKRKQFLGDPSYLLSLRTVLDGLLCSERGISVTCFSFSNRKEKQMILFASSQI